MTRVAALSLVAALGTAWPATAQENLWPREEPQIVFDGVFAYWGSMCDCDVRDMVLRTLVPVEGHAQPTRSSPVVRVVDANRLIEGNDWDADLTVVTRAPTGTLRAPLRVTDARLMSDPRRGNWDDVSPARPFTIPAGTRVAVYDSYSDSGSARFGETTYYGTVPMTDDLRGASDDVTSSYWWRLTPKGDTLAAWVEIDWGNTRRLQMLCETHGGCVAGFTPSFRPNR